MNQILSALQKLIDNYPLGWWDKDKDNWSHPKKKRVQSLYFACDLIAVLHLKFDPKG